MAKLLPSSPRYGKHWTSPDVSGGWGIHTKKGSLEPIRASHLLLHTVLRFTTSNSATLATLGRLLRMVFPLPVLVLRDLCGHSFFHFRGRDPSLRAFITGTDIVQVLATFRIRCFHLVTAIEIVPWS